MKCDFLQARILSVFNLLKRVGFVVLLLGRNDFALGQWTEPQLLRPPINVDPSGEYYYSTISADGLILCLTINTQSGFGDDDVYLSERIDDSTWTRPVNAGPNVNHEGRNLSPSITSDRQRLYYVSYNAGSYDLFVSRRTGPDWDDWSPGEQLPEPINRGREFTGQISFDDSTLVFTSTGQPGMHEGGDAAFTSRLQPDGTWSEPEEIAYHLFFPDGFLHPCLTLNGDYFIYGQWWGSNLEILYSVRTDTGFGPAIRCDSTINTTFWDSGPSCPADGSELIFESRRNPGGLNGPARLYRARRVMSPVHERSPIASSFYLSAFPNPFNSTLSISLDVPLHRDVTLSLYDLLGREVDVVYRGRLSSSTISYVAPAALSSGVYFLRASAGSQAVLGKVVCYSNRKWKIGNGKGGG
ncbi:MAG: PD40 domain-containing protein [bacterium]|nr:PD40 domain-containing protein [bacterium]